MNTTEIVSGQAPKSESLRLYLALEDLGFRNIFNIQRSQLTCRASESAFNPNQVRLMGLYRFEGHSDPADMSVVYALEADDGTRGYMTDAFGHDHSKKLHEFMQQVRDCRIEAQLQHLPADREITIKTREVSPAQLVVN